KLYGRVALPHISGARLGNPIDSPGAGVKTRPVFVCLLLVTIAFGALSFLTKTYSFVPYRDAVHTTFDKTFAEVEVIFVQQKIFVEPVNGKDVVAPRRCVRAVPGNGR